MIGVIADDLSGAAEIGALGLRHGLTAEIICRGRPSGRAKLVCIDTDSRSSAPEEAARRTAKAARLLREAGADWIYKKVDSVLRGHITAELEAMAGALDLPRAFIVPANPSRGRVIRNGRYYVEGRPIHETEFARDPEHPRTSSKVLELLEPSMTFPVKVVRRREELPPNGIAVGEATRSVDLEKWAARRFERTAFGGAAEFFAALLRLEGYELQEKSEEKEESLAEISELFVCGSTSKAGRSFVGAARAKKVPVFSLPSELAWGAEFSDIAKRAVAKRAIAAFRQSNRVILNVGLPTLRGAEAARMLTSHLVQLAEMVLADANVTHVYAEGGATAAALVQRMGWERLTVLRELAPGVARLGVVGNRSTVLAIKPGSYVWPADIRKGVDLACEASA